MANIKSAKKRILVAEKNAARNKAVIEAGDKAAAADALKAASIKLSKAAGKGIYHKNTASRKISRLASAVNKMA